MPRGVYKRKIIKGGGVLPTVAAGPSSQTTDAILYLRLAKVEIFKQMYGAKPNKNMDRAHLYALLALDTLQGGKT